MIRIDISDVIKEAAPCLHILAIECTVKNSNSNPNLWKEILLEEERIRASVKIEQINKWSPIEATRTVYKRLGKEPNRYRPSAESLRRRVVKGLSLYKIDTLVDLINLVSLHTGYSIGGFDRDKISGESLELGVGKDGELYHGIGRGELNISSLPVYRDELGGIGTPTSDEERTKISLGTSRLLMIINGYSGLTGLVEAGQYSLELLYKYASAEAVQSMMLTKDRRDYITLSDNNFDNV